MTQTIPSEPAGLRMALEQLTEHGTPPPGSAPVFDVGTTEFVRFFEREILEGLIRPGGATCRFFVGSYGSGKTHLLQLLELCARGRGMAVVRIDLSQALSLEDWRMITAYVLENITVTLDSGTVRGLPRLLERLGLGVHAQAFETAVLPHPGFRTAMLRAVHGAGLSERAWTRLADYLTGQRVGAGELRRLGIFGVKDPLSARNAEQVLNTVLGGLHYLGVPGTMLLFDENERTFDHPRRWAQSRRIQLAANLVRRLVDACFTGGLIGTVAVFAVLPNFLEACSMVYPALGQRLEVVRGGPYEPAWRWPVLTVQDVNSIHIPEEFLAEAVKAFLGILMQCGAEADGLEERMYAEGQQILQSNAGTGYRRALIKALATTAIDQL